MCSGMDIDMRLEVHDDEDDLDYFVGGGADAPMNAEEFARCARKELRQLRRRSASRSNRVHPIAPRRHRRPGGRRRRANPPFSQGEPTSELLEV